MKQRIFAVIVLLIVCILAIWGDNNTSKSITPDEPITVTDYKLNTYEMTALLYATNMSYSLAAPIRKVNCIS